MRTLVLAIIVIPILSFSQTASEFEKMAEKKLEQKDYPYALELINKAIALDNKNIWYYLSKANIQFYKSGTREAINTIKYAISLNEKESESYNRAGTYYDSGGITDSAIIMYNLAIKYAKNDTIKKSYIINRGAAKTGMRDFEGAIADFEIALAFDPNDIAALTNISPCYRQLGRPDKSIICLKKCIALDPAFVGGYGNLGFIYSEMDSLDLAISYFNKVLELQPDEAVGYNNRGHIYYKKGDFANALKDINHSIQLYPTNSYAFRNLALVYIAQGKTREACNAIQYAISYGFERRYGTEVNELSTKYCKQ